MTHSRVKPQHCFSEPLAGWGTEVMRKAPDSSHVCDSCILQFADRTHVLLPLRNQYNGQHQAMPAPLLHPEHLIKTAEVVSHHIL